MAAKNLYVGQYNKALKRLKFAADQDDVNALLRHFADNHTSHGLHLPEMHGGISINTDKGALADALDEQNRSGESQLLRSDVPVYIWRGRVHHGAGNWGGANLAARGYINAALGEDWHNRHVNSDTLREMRADAQHFYHSAHTAGIPLYYYNGEQIGDSFWHDRNGHNTIESFMPEFNAENSQYEVEHGVPLHQLATAAGPYHLDHVESDPDHGIFGWSPQENHWGQQHPQ